MEAVWKHTICESYSSRNPAPVTSPTHTRSSLVWSCLALLASKAVASFYAIQNHRTAMIEMLSSLQYKKLADAQSGALQHSVFMNGWFDKAHLVDILLLLV